MDKILGSIYNEDVRRAHDWMSRHLYNGPDDNFEWVVNENEITNGSEDSIQDNVLVLKQFDVEKGNLSDFAPLLEISNSIPQEFGVQIKTFKNEFASEDSSPVYIAQLIDWKNKKQYQLKNNVLSQFLEGKMLVNCELVARDGKLHLIIEICNEKNTRLVVLSDEVINEENKKHLEDLNIPNLCNQINKLLVQEIISRADIDSLESKYVFDKLDNRDDRGESFMSVFLDRTIEGTYKWRDKLRIDWATLQSQALTQVIKDLTHNPLNDLLHNEEEDKTLVDDSYANLMNICRFLDPKDSYIPDSSVAMPAIALFDCILKFDEVNGAFNRIISELKSAMLEDKEIGIGSMSPERVKMVTDYLLHSEKENLEAGIPRILIRPSGGRSLRNSKWSDYGLMYLCYIYHGMLFLSRENEPRPDYGYRNHAFTKDVLIRSFDKERDIKELTHPLTLNNPDERIYYSKSVVKMPVIELVFEVFNELSKYIETLSNKIFDIRHFIMLKALIEGRYFEFTLLKDDDSTKDNESKSTNRTSKNRNNVVEPSLFQQ